MEYKYEIESFVQISKCTKGVEDIKIGKALIRVTDTDTVIDIDIYLNKEKKKYVYSYSYRSTCKCGFGQKDTGLDVHIGRNFDTDRDIHIIIKDIDIVYDTLLDSVSDIHNDVNVDFVSCKA